MRIVRSLSIVLILSLGTELSGQPFDFRGAPANHAVAGILRTLAGKAALKTDEMEVAIFIVREPDGDFTCRLWPHTASRRSEHYKGSIPTGTVAIGHTHPYYMPLPSGGDVAESTRIGLPIYVVSRWEVNVVDPASGKNVLLLRGTAWSDIAERRECTQITMSR